MFTNLAFVDVETNGSSATRDRIIEIGILRVENGKVVETYNQLINPEASIPPFISSMTGITQDDVETAPTFAAIREDVYRLLDGCIFVAHNARFDYGFIRNEFKRQDYTFQTNVLCTARLSRLLFPEYRRHSVEALISRYGLQVEHRHRAFDDAKVLWDYYQYIHGTIEHETLTQALRQVTRLPATPVHLPPGILDEIPDDPGVYELYGEGPVPLYIGKSKHIRTRVLSHFSGDYTSDREMELSRQTKDITYTRTAGEIGAALLEDKLIKQKSPLYNKRSRKAELQMVLFEDTTKEGYKTVQIVTMGKIPQESVPEIVTVSRSKATARELLEGICKDHRLCPSRMGLVRGNGSCFNYKLGLCTGACCNEESTDSYNKRFDTAFAKLNVQPWPYSGMIGYKDHGDIHIFDQWCYLDTVQEEHMHSVFETSYSGNFDYGIYRMMKRILLKNPHRVISLSGQNTS